MPNDGEPIFINIKIYHNYICNAVAANPKTKIDIFITSRPPKVPARPDSMLGFSRIVRDYFLPVGQNESLVISGCGF